MNNRLDLKRILNYQRKFVFDRRWAKFHTPKNLTMALAGEVGELLEIFQWLDEHESKRVMQKVKSAQSVRHEIADIFYYLLRLCDELGVDIEKALWEKFALNEKKYPVHLCRGSAKKYTELRAKSGAGSGVENSLNRD